MLKRPSSRRRSSQEPVILNLVPILDAMVTLISFLLFSMSFLAIVTIESPFPQTSAEQVEEKLKERPLQLTITVREKETEIWSPFDRIDPKIIPHSIDNSPNTIAIHEMLLAVKNQFPTETSVVLVPHPGLSYDGIISVMDSARALEPTDPPLFIRNEQTGNDEPVKSLFPNLVFGNLLGDS